MHTRSNRPARTLAHLAMLGGCILSLTLTSACKRDDQAGATRTSAQSPAQSPEQSSETESLRVAALLPFAADQLIELGVTPVAVPLLRGELPEAWDGIPVIAVDHSAGPNIEQLMAASPDVVVTTSVYAQFMPAVEQSTGAKIVMMDIDTIEDVATNITALGELTGNAEGADQLIESINTELSQNETTDKPVRVLAVFGTPHAFYAFLPSSYLGDLVASAGGSLITDDMETHGVFRGLAPLSMEAVIERDPDHLLVIFHGPEESARAMLQRDALWGQLTAVKENHVTFLKDDLYAMRPGSELPRAMADIRGIIDEARSRLP